jgi:hypothetical protein
MTPDYVPSSALTRHGMPTREDLESYDIIITAFSGGKDNIACVLAMIEAGAPRERMWLIHHHVDGREGSTLMDWGSTPGYCHAFARFMGIRIIDSWRENGLEGEMLRDNSATAAVCFEIDGVRTRCAPKPHSPKNTRLKFPQVAASLTVRWCSSVLKIDVADRVLANHPMFRNKRILFITGERAEESPNRAKYKEFEIHRADARNGRLKRHVDHLRPVLRWPEAAVWDIMRRHGIRPHTAYLQGFGRLSCRACIFADSNQWATLQAFDNAGFEAIAAYEKRFDRTIHRQHSVRVRAAQGFPFAAATAEGMQAALSPFDGPIHIDPELWTMPAGAFQRHGGPT